jgi:branched-chain amino acid transport system permease protein
LGDFWLYLLNLCGIAIVGAQGLNILTGFTGQISLGHGAFIGVGAYTAGVLATKLGAGPGVALPAAGVAAAAVGLLFGLPSLRIKGFYLAMATLAAQFILEYLFMQAAPLTGGAQGLYLERPSALGVVIDSDAKFFYGILAAALLATATARNLLRTDVGRCLVAIRDRDIAAELIGVNLFAYKLLAFALSSFYAGIAGGLLAYYVSAINPQAFTVQLSVDYLAMIIIGGLGSVLGATLGAVFITLLPEILKLLIDAAGAWLPIENIFPALREITFGLLIVLFLLREPEGLAKLWWDIKAYWKLWPFAY